MAAVFVVSMLPGCLLECPTLDDAASEEPPEPPKTVVVVLDVTGSFSDSFDRAKTALCEEVRRARPGDEWYFCTITQRSCSDRAVVPGIEHVEFPAVPDADNPFSRGERAASEQATAEFEQTQERVMDALEDYRPEPVQGTDIYGALSKASSLLDEREGRRVLIVASNFGETEGLQAEVDLSGVEVHVLFQGGPEPAEVARRRASWEKQLRGFGVPSVSFVDRPNWTRPIIAVGSGAP